MNKTALIAGLSALALASCGGSSSARADSAHQTTPGAGGTATQTYDLSGFTGIDLAGPDDVTVTRGDSFSVIATGRASDLENLRIRVREGKLEIGRKSGMSWRSSDGVQIHVTLPVLSRLALAGSGTVTADTLSGDDAKVDLAGSGEVHVTGAAPQALELSSAGSGTITVAGTANKVEANIVGSGDIRAPDLRSTTADVSVLGSGSVMLAVTGTADISVAGSGDVTITGGATCKTEKMGSGDVNCS